MFVMIKPALIILSYGRCWTQKKTTLIMHSLLPVWFALMTHNTGLISCFPFNQCTQNLILRSNSEEFYIMRSQREEKWTLKGILWHFRKLPYFTGTCMREPNINKPPSSEIGQRRLLWDPIIRTTTICATEAANHGQLDKNLTYKDSKFRVIHQETLLKGALCSFLDVLHNHVSN